MATVTGETSVPPGFESYAAESLPGSPAGAGSVGKGGTLDLRFARGTDGRSRLVYDRATVPFHLTGGLYHDEELPAAAAAYVQDPTGGIAQGDRYEATVAVGADARAHVSTGSATKVLRMERNYGASTVDIEVESGGYLEYLPEPTILHAGSRFAGSVEVDLAPDAAVLVADVLVPGRLAREPPFSFERVHTSVAARCDDRPLFADAVRLDGGDGDAADHLRGPGGFGEFRVVGTFYVVAPDHDDVGALADDLHDCVAGDGGETEAEDEAETEDEDAEAAGGASVLPRESGVAVRVLGRRTSDVTERFGRVWDRARRELVGAGAPDTRKF
jgi:urease accessory protein